MIKRSVITMLLTLLALVSVSGLATAKVSQVQVVQTTANLSQKLKLQRSLQFESVHKAGHFSSPVVAVNDQVHYQRFHAVGAALTDSSACLIAKLPANAQRALVQELFGANGGIHLNFLRIPMGASDFSCTGEPYSYDDLPQGQTDPSLNDFSIAHDRAYIIPVLREILRVNPHIQILANPWSAPAWMKSNDSMGGGGSLDADDYSAYADYFTKFIQDYSAAGIHINAITPENEPGVGPPYPSMTFPVEDEVNFVIDDLWKAVHSLGVSIYGYDMSWDDYAYPQTLADSTAGSELAGIAWHCYNGSPSAMSAFHDDTKHRLAMDQIVSECSPEIRPFSTAELEIASFRNWATTVAVWNVVLDPAGGPVEGQNTGCTGCTGVATVNPATRRYWFGQKFYQLGQVGEFVRPGAWRIQSNAYVEYGDFQTGSSGLDDVAFLNPGGERVLVVYNQTSAKKTFRVKWHGRFIVYSIPAGATTTFTWR